MTANAEKPADKSIPLSLIQRPRDASMRPNSTMRPVDTDIPPPLGPISDAAPPSIDQILKLMALLDRPGPGAGRRPTGSAKVALSIRLDADVVQAFRATGPGWQTRINDTLRAALS